MIRSLSYVWLGMTAVISRTGAFSPSLPTRMPTGTTTMPMPTSSLTTQRRHHQIASAMTLHASSLTVEGGSINNNNKKDKNNNNDKTKYEFALLFDCDGVILETEELHRLAYNKAFAAAGLTINEQKPVVWSVEYYDVLQNTVGGGKPKMFFHFRNTTGQFPYVNGQAPPETLEEQQALIDRLQAHKTAIYRDFIEEKAVPRPGVLELMDEALADPTVAVGVCSASTKEAVQKVLAVTLGEDRQSQLDVCILGDDVSAKKPDPMIYNEARKRLAMDPDKCVVIEDSMVGLRAAKAAGMKCIITYTSSTEEEDFYGEGADAKVPDLGSRKVTLEKIFGPIRQEGLDADMLLGIKDPPSTIKVAVPGA